MISNRGCQRYHGFPTTPQPHRRIYGLGMGTVCHGAGTVRENPTRGLPVLNPTYVSFASPSEESMCSNTGEFFASMD